LWIFAATHEKGNMDNLTKTLAKRLILLSACSAVVMIPLALETGRGHLSPRGLGISLLIVCFSMGVGFALIVRRTASEFKVPPPAPGSPIDDDTRKRLLLSIRGAKAMIILLAAGLVFGLSQGGPPLPLLVGAAINLSITAWLILRVRRLQKTLKST
jgi:hypothetical protein